MRFTKIVATIGPASSSPAMIKKLLKEGVNVFRLNFSHSNHESHKEIINRIRKISKEIKKPIAILADLQGPKLRTGKLHNHKPIYLKKKQKITLATKAEPSDNITIFSSYKALPKEVKKGDLVLINDGLIQLKVNKVRTNAVDCEVLEGGELGEHKGINLPGSEVKAPALTNKDKRDLTFILNQEIDYIALSFVRKATDIVSIKKVIKNASKSIPVIAKIEKPQALKNIDSILKVADGIMIARGDLGVEMKTEEVPIVQKYLIEKAAMAHKFVITATQMLESMIHSARPTRAEASDVSNAIMDGTDAVMLSAETATGDHPIEAVQTMSKISVAAESSPYLHRFDNLYDPDKVNISLAAASAAYSAVYESKAKAILVFTKSGNTALMMSKIKPNVPIIALTPLASTYNRLSLYWGVIPMMSQFTKSSITLIKSGIKSAVRKKLLHPNDTVIVLIGEISAISGTNAMKILKVSDLL